MNEGRAHGCLEVLDRCHVSDRVVDEYRIELALQPEISHISLEVLALGIEFAAECQHLG
jgi:hypothetical protein